MNYLLDTHYLIWAVLEPQRITHKVKTIISNKANKVYVSALSLWEISILVAKGSVPFGAIKPDDMPLICEKLGFDILPLTAADSSTFYQLNTRLYGDYFDKMIVWQAIHNGLILITEDKAFEKFKAQGLKML